MLIKLHPEHFVMPSLNFQAFLKGEVCHLFAEVQKKKKKTSPLVGKTNSQMRVIGSCVF